MQYETTREVPADAARTWQVLTDLERWPEWIEVYESVRRTDPGPLAVGSRAQVKQRGLRAGSWEVTELVEGRSFSWVSGQPGVRTVAWHRVQERPGGTAALILGVRQTGWLAGVVGLLLGGRIRRYVDSEADGLTAAAGPGQGTAG